jgi:hypothetical protein
LTTEQKVEKVRKKFDGTIQVLTQCLINTRVEKEKNKTEK